MSWTDTILAADRAGFLAVNGAHSAAADPWMVLLSDPRIWIPVYALFLVLIKLRWGWRGLWWSLPVAALMIFCSDTASVVFFKNTVHRLRPCHAPDLEGMVLLRCRFHLGTHPLQRGLRRLQQRGCRGQFTLGHRGCRFQFAQ